MQEFALVVGLVLSMGMLPVMAQQETPRAEVSGDFSYVRVDTLVNSIQNAAGASGSVAVNLNRFLGAVGDVGVYKLTAQPAGQGVTIVSFLFGPRVSFRQDEHVTPFMQLLLGGAHLSPESGSSRTSFAMAAGGGLDVKATRHLAIRIVQAEYLMTRFPLGTINRTEHNVRLSGGVVFRLGEKK